MGKNSILPIPELAWAGIAVNLSAMIESVDGVNHFVHESWYPFQYGFLLLVTLAFAVWNARKVDQFGAQISRVILFFLGTAGLAMTFHGDLSRLVILAFGLMYLFVPISRKRVASHLGGPETATTGVA